ncbi:peptidase U32 [Erysipelotrichaceae bacterium]|nr:peptidase U32 [Erysipelotrichaceae bacterium]
MEFLIAPCSHEHLLEVLQSSVEAVIIGDAQLSLRLCYTYELNELPQVLDLIAKAQKKAYIDVHTMVDNATLKQVERIIETIKFSAVEGIVFSDPAVYQIALNLGCQQKLVLNTETTTTNWFSGEYWVNKGVSHIALAKELTADAITSMDMQMPKKATILEIQVFGALNMFHSRRNLLNNYYNHLEIKSGALSQTNYLFDPERNNHYPIFEDASGTHIMSPRDVCLIDELAFFEKMEHPTMLKIDGKGHDALFMNSVISNFLEAREMCLLHKTEYEKQGKAFQDKIAKLYQGSHRTIDKGFFYKPTIY